MPRSSSVTIMNASVRDTNPVVGTLVAISGLSRIMVINNTLNQAGNYAVDYSYDGGTTWAVMNAAIPLTANSGLFVINTIGGFSNNPNTGMYRITYTASVAPASGSLYIALQTYYG